MPNQFTKGTRKEHDESTKDRIRAELLSQRYYKFAMATGKRASKMGLNAAQVASAKMLIDKGKPSLQSVEQSNANPWDQLSEEEMREQVKALITLHPWLLKEFQPGIRPPELVPGDPNTVTDTQQKAG
jgi:hypothetical protein